MSADEIGRNCAEGRADDFHHGQLASDDGRRMAVQALFLAQGRYVWRVLLRLGVHTSDVEDLCQEVFSTAFRRFDDFEGRAAMTSWLYGICLRQAANYRRKAHRRYEETSEVAFEQEALGDPEQAAQAGEVQRDIDQALDRLSEAKRQVFVLYEFGELDMPEVARAVGASEKTCYSRLYAARRELRARLSSLSTAHERPLGPSGTEEVKP